MPGVSRAWRFCPLDLEFKEKHAATNALQGILLAKYKIRTTPLVARSSACTNCLKSLRASWLRARGHSTTVGSPALEGNQKLIEAPRRKPWLSGPLGTCCHW
jgi:hypothetical protein